jgi:uncharacterized protein (DUF4415 family)
MKKKKTDATKPDADNPQWTDKMFREAKPFNEAFPELASAWKRTRGRPKAAMPKVNTTFRLSQDIVQALKKSGLGYSVRVEHILREALEQGRL